jgi:cytochrome c-type biogenesis protein CcmE
MRKTQLAGLLFVVVATGAIISTVYNADTYADFEQAREHPGREFHIIGALLRDLPIEERLVDQTLLTTFSMVDHQGYQAEVTYFGAKPQDFEKSDQVVLIGRYDGERFVASSLLLKCPSKYNPESLQPEAFGTTTHEGGH